MPQNANAATIATNPSGKQVALQTDVNGLLKVTTQEVNADPKSVFNITAATVRPSKLRWLKAPSPEAALVHGRGPWTSTVTREGRCVASLQALRVPARP